MSATSIEFVLHTLRCIGLCPLTKTSKGHYEFQWRSTGVLWNIGMALIACLVHFIYVTHVVFKQFFIFGPGQVNAFYKSNTLLDLMTKLFRIRHTLTAAEANIRRNSTHSRQDQAESSLNIAKFIAFSSCIQFFVIAGASWLNRHVLPELLNHQRQLELTLLGTPAQRNSWHEHLKRLLILASALMMASIPTFLVIMTTSPHPNAFLEIVLHSFIWSYTAFGAVLHEHMIILSFRTLRQQFERVRNSMHVWSERKCEAEAVSDDVLNGWCETLLRIRHQGDLLSRYLAPTQLPAMLLAIVLCTLCLFFSLNVTQGLAAYEENSEKTYAIVGNLSCAVITLLILYCNASLAQKITNQVAT